MTPHGETQCEYLATAFPHFTAFRPPVHRSQPTLNIPISGAVTPSRGSQSHSPNSHSGTHTPNSSGTQTPPHKRHFFHFGHHTPPKDEGYNGSLIVASPLKRTIQTALIGLKPAIDGGVVPILAMPLFQETGDYQCDTGSNRAELEKVFAKEVESGLVDFSPCREGWTNKVRIHKPISILTKHRSNVDFFR